jgi:hypothetical protein
MRSAVRPAQGVLRQAHEVIEDAMAGVMAEPPFISTSNVTYASPKVGTQSYNLAQLRQ